MNSFFHSVFATNSLKPTVYPRSCPDDQLLTEIHLSVAEVEAVLVNLELNKACGPDNIPGRLLKSTAEAIAPSLCYITPVHKHDDHWQLTTDRSHCCVSSQKSWGVVFLTAALLTRKLLCHLQHGFRPERSTESQLLVVYHDLLNTVASGKEIDAIYLDVPKAFDKVPHYLLLAKL